MNDTTRVEVRPEVSYFLDKVRARLSDLSEEQRDDLLGGLEADLSELVADGGSVAELGDPRAYADELRSAAGVAPARRSAVRGPSRLLAVPTWKSIAGGLDSAHEQWDRWATSRPGLAKAWEVAQTLRPVWWVLRAWVAVQLLDLYTGPWEYATLIPRFNNDLTGVVLLAGAVVGSVLMGMRKVWPASHAPVSAFARVVLLGLNALAILWTPVVIDSFPSARLINDYAHPAASGMLRSYERPGLQNDGRTVRNVFAYDAEGHPLQGVQLYDQTGKPLAIDPDLVGRVRYAGRLARVYSWVNDEQKAWNVYPLAVRFGGGWGHSTKAWTSDNPPFLPQPPLVAVPPVSLPLPEPDPHAEQKDAEQSAADATPEGTKPERSR
jgi:hypothetical protein